MDNRKNLLVTLADKNYVQQAKQLFSSVYWNAGWEGDYMLFSHEIPEQELKWFRDKGILIKKCVPLYHNITGEYNYPPVIFDKLYLFTPELKNWKNIVFLDADIIVKASLERLTKIKQLGAVQDFYFKKLFSQLYDPLKNQFNNVTYDLNVPAFNSGVIAFNTDMIANSTFGELNLFIKNYPSDFKYPEQAVLNLYFYKKWKKLPLLYNTFIAYHHLKLPDWLKCIVIHFIRCPDYPSLWDIKNPFYQEWKTNLEKAEFIDLNKIQKVKKWSILKTKYYSLLFKMNLFVELAPHKLKKFFFIYRIKGFFVYKLKYFFLYLINTPGRIMGQIGNFIKKNNPDLYHKLRKIKGGK